MAEVRIGDTIVGDNHPCYITAEIGINHNGNIEIAKQLIELADAAGCNAVKFQKRTVDVVYTPDELAKPRENPFGPTNGDLKRGLEFGLEEYREIDRYCKELGIAWFASCLDEGALDFIAQFNPPCYKIASASLTLLFQYLYSQILGLTTALQLLEISRPDHPLLQFILRNAPGTYQHSLQVSNLAEQAAEQIGVTAVVRQVRVVLAQGEVVPGARLEGKLQMGRQVKPDSGLQVNRV